MSDTVLMLGYVGAMRVLVVTTWYPTPSSPATGIFVARDVAAIATRHEVRVLHLCHPSLLGPAGGHDGPARGSGSVPVEVLAMDPKRPDHLLRAARRIRAMSSYADVLHTMAVSALLPLTGWRPDVPWIHTEHWSGLMAPETLTPTLRLARSGITHLLRRPDVVAVVGEDLAAGVRALREGPVVVVPNIVQPPAIQTPRRLPDRPLTQRGSFDLVGVGGLIDRKDPLSAVDTTAVLRSRGVDAWLTWVGEGPLREAVEQRARSAGVPLHVTGTVPPEAVRDTLNSSDVFLLPTRAETFCVAAAEALAAGRPVVVGDSGGPRDFVRPPTGLLVPPGAPPEVWADAVEEVWRATAALSARQISANVTTIYSAAHYAERVDAVYQDLVRAARRDIAPPHRGSHSFAPRARARGGAAPPNRGTQSFAPRARAMSRPGRAGSHFEPLVDLVIATHSATRATEQAVRSVLDGSGDLAVRVTVVCHNVPPADITVSLSQETLRDPRVRILDHHDGLASPAGPFTLGIESATAPWVSIMGSDDRLSPGALEHWLDTAERTGAEVVLAQVELDGVAVATPPTRVSARRQLGRRRSDLDLVRDRLSYRSAPLGLLSRAAIHRTGARLLAGAEVGEDVQFALKLWSGARVALADRSPYLIGTDAGDRMTYVPRPIRKQLVAVTHLLDDEWLATLTQRERSAIAIKLLRVHVFGAILTRPDPAWWTAEERGALAETTQRLLDAAPGSAGPLSLADHDLLRAVLDPSLPAGALLDRARARRHFGHPRTLVPHDWRRMLDQEAPLRFMASSLVARRG
ncbi:MAG: glycosyltransferase [Ornithinimicrobium sp.]|uniref:glycosyltransferase n=1 Tax=Ornithinimicrobium sp. TaxID=1977084 RepID=UPI0026E07975|nr:glycosyltransferase [Ornithinimicrobium sp.]MDO5740077.1 glycosyltransferase [Ornithinimicrobium sp.]